MPNARAQSEKLIDWSLMEILESEEIPCENERCPQLATQLCTKHWKALCQQCVCAGSTCTVQRFGDSEMDIGGLLYKELENKRETVPRFAERHYRAIGTLTNRRKLQLLRSLYTVPYCSECKEPAQTSYYFYIPGDYYCHSCAEKLCTEGRLSPNCMSLNSPTETPLDILRSHILSYLHTIDVFTVSANPEELYSLLREKFDTASLYDMQTIAAKAFGIGSTGVESENTVCPGCSISFPTSLFQQLPCVPARHAICGSCLSHERARQENVTICPLDQMQYKGYNR